MMFSIITPNNAIIEADEITDIQLQKGK